MTHDEYIEKVQTIIGSPEENRETLVKAILLDKKMTCKSCNLTYRTGADMEQLEIKFNVFNNPGKLLVGLGCHCGHSGEFTFRPNPLIR